MHDASSTWLPGPTEFGESGVARLIQAIGASDYDDLLRRSLHEPEAYWRAVAAHCGFAWAVPPAALVDTSRGREFPRWFPGGRLNWVNTVLAWAERPQFRDRLAVVAEREDGRMVSLTWAGLALQVRAFAAALRHLGVVRDDRVGLLMDNGVEATVSMLAVAALGGVAVPLFSGFGADAVANRLADAEAVVLLATTGFRRRGRRIDVQATVREARARLPALRHVVWKRDDDASAPDGAGEHDWHALARAAEGCGIEPELVDADDAFLLIYTSGTTGRPKGVVHTHAGFPLKIAHDALVHFDVHPGDVFCWPADMGWIAGTLVLGCALLRGATLVCYDGAPDFPDWGRLSRLVARHRVTHFGSAPTLIRGLAAHEKEALAGDVSSIRLLITAGEGIAPEHFVWFQRSFGQGTRPLINYTGGTEASGALLGSVVVRPIVPSAFNSVSPGVAVDVVDAEGRPVGDAVGELVVREPFVGMTRSFWRDDERYLETYWRTLPGVWVHGDLALRRADGMHFLVGRSDDTLKVAGKRLGPAEVEAVAIELPGVVEAAAIGVHDRDKGQKLVVFVVATASAQSAALEDRVAANVETRLGRPFRPAAVHLVRQLPKTRSSKVMRRVVRNLYIGQPAGDLSALDDPAALDEIRAIAGGA